MKIRIPSPEAIKNEWDWRERERDLSAYVKGAWGVLEPKTPLAWNWHHDLICEYLTACKLGQIRRLIINVPPRTTKSIISTICFPSWVWTDKPTERFVFGSFSDQLSRQHSILRRGLIKSPWYQSRWADKFQIKDDQNRQDYYENTHTGKMKSASIMGSITGEGGDYVILDDPQNPKQVYSDLERKGVLDEIDRSWMNRLDDKKTGRIIVIMQRLHEQDVTGHLLAKESGFEHVLLPAEAEQRTVHIFPISKQERVREPGDILHPEREGKTELNAVRKDMGARDYSGQYQQRPTAMEGNIIKRKDFQYYKALPDSMDEVRIFADLNYEAGEENDFTVVEAWGRKGVNLYLLDQIRECMGYAQQLNAIRQMKLRYPQAFDIRIEKKANGFAVIETLKGEIMGVNEFIPKTSKGARLWTVSPLFEGANVWYPHPDIAPWILINENEILAMSLSGSTAAHDDTVDVCSMALIIMGQVIKDLEKLKALAKR